MILAYLVSWLTILFIPQPLPDHLSDCGTKLQNSFLSGTINDKMHRHGGQGHGNAGYLPGSPVASPVSMETGTSKFSANDHIFIFF